MFNTVSKYSPVVGHMWNLLIGYKQYEIVRENPTFTLQDETDGFCIKIVRFSFLTYVELFTTVHPTPMQP